MAKRMEELSRRYLPQHDWALAEQDWWETHSNTQFTTTCLHKKSQKVKFKMKSVQKYWAQVFPSVLGPTSPRENLALSIQCFEVGYFLVFQFHIFQHYLVSNWFIWSKTIINQSTGVQQKASTASPFSPRIFRVMKILLYCIFVAAMIFHKWCDKDQFCKLDLDYGYLSFAALYERVTDILSP